MRKFIILAIILAILAIPCTVVSAAPPEDGPPGLERAIAVKERNEARLLAIPGVVGAGVALNGDNRPAVIILTEKPGLRGLPASLEEIPVVVRVSGKLVATPRGGKKPPGHPSEPAPDAEWPRPVPIGVSTGHFAITAGTIAARVKDAQDNVYALSNNHIYANTNEADIGDNVLQPGPVDGGVNPDDAIGTLFDWETIDFSPSSYNEMDAAIAISSTDDLGNQTPSNGYGLPKSQIVEAYPSMRVKKYGRTTGLTKGRIYGIEFTLEGVNYGDGNLANFKHIIVIYPPGFSWFGDSGSLIVTDLKGRDDRKPVGLLFAGSYIGDTNIYTFANPIDLVLSRFGVTIDDTE